MTQKTSLIEFPCYFPIKVFVENKEPLIQEIIQLTKKHFHQLKESDVTIVPSKKNQYASVTLNVYAKDKASLDDLYQSLSKHPAIKLVL